MWTPWGCSCTRLCSTPTEDPSHSRCRTQPSRRSLGSMRRLLLQSQRAIIMFDGTSKVTRMYLTGTVIRCVCMCENIPTVLCANKVDVKTGKGWQNLCFQYYDISAKRNYNFKKSFSGLPESSLEILTGSLLQCLFSPHLSWSWTQLWQHNMIWHDLG